MDVNTRFTEWYAHARKKTGMRVTSKDQELRWLWKTVDLILRLLTFGKQNRFYTNYTTTLFKTVYFPAGWSIDKAQLFDCITLRHENCHIQQNKSWGLGNVWIGTILMGFAYLFLPFPFLFAWFRYKMEREAYRISYYTAIELKLNPNLEHYVNLLTGPEYFWTWYSKKQVRAWFRRNCRYNT